MYCRRCGNEITDDAAFCPRCGTAQDRPVQPAPTTDSTLIILALIVFFPLGLWLMWRSHWDDDVKYAVTGIFLPPMWIRFVWRQRWTIAPRAVLAALLVIGPAILDNILFHIGATAAIFILLINLVVAFLVIRSVEARRATTLAPPDTLRQSVSTRLAACHDLVLEVERSGAVDHLSDAARRQYVRALELQSEATRLFERATTGPELAVVDARISEALAELRSIQSLTSG